MINLVQELMSREDGWLNILTNVYKIDAVSDGDLVSLKYSQIESPMHEPIVQQCRGMVVDAARRRVLGWSYNKFWNLGEALAALIDWSTARVLEKLDGSLMQLFHDGADWRVSSSGHPTAGGSFGSDERTAYGWLCYAAEQMRCEVVQCLPYTSFSACDAAVQALDPIKCEGFVVVDDQFNRVKIKSPRYVALHHLKGNATPRRAIELWQSGEHEELLAHFPEFRPVIEPVHDKLDELARRAVFEHEQAIKCTTDRKGYAALAVQRPFSAVMFKLLTNGGASVDEAKSIMWWQCDPEASLHAQLAADTDRAWREHERDEDLAQEEILAHEAVDDYGDESDGCPWPEYSDRFDEVVEPEIIEGAPDWPVLADPEEDEDDL